MNLRRSRKIRNQTEEHNFKGRLKTWVPAFAGMTMCAISSTLLRAEPTIAVRADAQPREVYIGDPIEYAVTVTVSSEITQLPFTLPPPLGDFELLAVTTPTVSIGKDGSNMTAFRFLLTTFSTGSATIPAVDEKSPGIQINVKSLLQEKGDEGNLRPLKGLFNFKSYFWLWALLFIAGVAAVGYLSWKYSSKRMGKNGESESGPPRPPEELAWEALHELEDADLIVGGQIKEFYFRLSVILRTYLERRYGFSALDRTTSELLGEFRRQNFALDLTNLLRVFFDNADLVKFAKFTPLEPEIMNDLNQVKQFVNVTTPKKPAPSEEKVTI